MRNRGASADRVGGLDRSRVAEQIFKELKDRIVLGAIPQGSKLPPERELAQQYGVSGPTVREAIRGLTLLGLVDVRHGSGTYVNTDTAALVAMSLSTVILLGNLGLADVLGILGVLNQHAARLAARSGTPADHARLHEALGRLEKVRTAEDAAEGVRDFHGAIADASRNPLLIALCHFLTELQTDLATELAGGSIKVWKKIFASLAAARTKLVEAIVGGDEEGAERFSREFQLAAVATITTLPRAKEIRLNDPRFERLLNSMLARI